MGISGLLPALRSINEPCGLQELKGKRVGVDCYCWLHKVCLTCAEELALGVTTDRYISYFQQRVRQLTQFGITPVLVFDGADIPMKQGTNQARRAGRTAARERAAALAQRGQRAEARQQFMRALEVTHVLASSVIDAMHDEGLECIVAPYEADAQLAYLAHQGYVDVVITEDSDLVAYLTPRILYKLDTGGTGQLLRSDRLGEAKDVSFADFSPDMILTNCIMAGCDYRTSLPGLGLKKSNGLVRAHRNIGRILEHIQTAPQYRNAAKHVHSYRTDFVKAFFAFKHHRVWDPRAKRVVHFQPLPDGGKGVSGDWLDGFLGPAWDPALAQLVCGSCTHDPTTLKPYARTLRGNLELWRSRRRNKPRLHGRVPSPKVPPAPTAKQDVPAWAAASGQTAAFRPPWRTGQSAREQPVWLGYDSDGDDGGPGCKDEDGSPDLGSPPPACTGDAPPDPPPAPPAPTEPPPAPPACTEPPTAAHPSAAAVLLAASQGASATRKSARVRFFGEPRCRSQTPTDHAPPAWRPPAAPCRTPEWAPPPLPPLPGKDALSALADSPCPHGRCDTVHSIFAECAVQPPPPLELHHAGSASAADLCLDAEAMTVDEPLCAADIRRRRGRADGRRLPAELRVLRGSFGEAVAAGPRLSSGPSAAALSDLLAAAPADVPREAPADGSTAEPQPSALLGAPSEAAVADLLSIVQRNDRPPLAPLTPNSPSPPRKRRRSTSPRTGQPRPGEWKRVRADPAPQPPTDG